MELQKLATIQSCVIFYFFSLLTACDLENDMQQGETNEGWLIRGNQKTRDNANIDQS